MGIDWRADDLRRQISEQNQTPKDAKPLSTAKCLELEQELESMRHPHREPERKNPFAPKEVMPSSRPESKTEPEEHKKGIMTLEKEK